MVQYDLDGLKEVLEEEPGEYQYEMQEIFNYHFGYDFSARIDDFGNIKDIKFDTTTMDEFKEAGFSEKQIKVLEELFGNVVLSVINLFVDRT